MKKITLIMAFIGLYIIQSKAQYVSITGEKTTTPPNTNLKMLNGATNCNNNGIGIIVNGGHQEPYAPGYHNACNSPNAAFTGIGYATIPRDPNSNLTYTFSKPINCATVSYWGVNNGDVGQITVDGGGTVTLSNACGANISGNILTCNFPDYFGNVTVKVSSTTPFTIISLTNIGGSSGWGQGNPCNFILNDCPTQSSTGCCPGKNLICNGGFEETKNCFESQYFGTAPTEGRLIPGSFTITDYANSSTICKQWNINQSPCSKTGKGMFVNGRTNGTGSKVIWTQKVNYNGWGQYRFCAEVLPLNQCCFNVAPKLAMKLTYMSGGNQKIIDLATEKTVDACGTIKYTGLAAAWEGSDGGTGTISIELDESGLGDGNDFVLDNIALIELKKVDNAITNNAQFSFAPDGSTMNGTFSGNLPNGVVGLWIVTPLLDASQNPHHPDPACPSAPLWWWSTNTNFPRFDGCGLSGTSPGKLIPNKWYKIEFATYGTCNAWSTRAWYALAGSNNLMKVIKVDDEKAVEKINPGLKNLIKKTQELIPTKEKN